MVFICASSFTTVWAEEKKTDAKKEAAPAMTDKEKAEYAKKVDLFIQLATYGETQKDPLVMLSAVKMLDALPFKGIIKPGQPEKRGACYEREALLNEAKQFAAGDKELLAVIAKVQTPPEKIAVRGHHGGGHHGYYERHHYSRHYDCNWYRVCNQFGDCELVCGR